MKRDIDKELEGQIPVFNNDEIWVNIEPKLKEKKKRRFIIWWFSGIGFALLGVWLLTNSALDKGSQGQLNDSVVIKANDVQSPEEELGSLPTAPAKAKVDVLEIQSDIQKQVPNEVIKRNKNAATSLRRSKEVKTTTVVDIDVRSISAPQESTTINSLKEQKEMTIITMDNDGLEPPTQTDIEVEDSNPVAIQNTTIAQSEVETNSKKQDDQESLKDEIIEEESVTISEDKDPTVIVEEVDESDNMSREERLQKRKEQIEKRKLAKKRRQAERIKPSKSSKWSREFMATASAVYGIEFENAIGEDGKTIEELRDKYFSSRVSGGVQMSHRWISPNGIIYQVGGQYLLINERFRREQEFVTQQQQLVTTHVILDDQGILTSQIQETRVVETTVTYNQLLNNQYHIFNLPIGMGYRGIFKKLRYSFAGGPYWNIYSSFRGETYNEKGLLLSFDQSNISLYRKKYRKRTGWGLWLEGHLERPITYRTSLVYGLGLNVPSRSLNTDDAKLKVTHLPIRMDIGLKFSFTAKPPRKTQRRKQ